MPALFAKCTACGYRFNYDYDLRQNRCQKCHAGFDWGPKGTNPNQVDSMRGDAGSGSGSRNLTAPILPGEPGHAEYAQKARQEHDASSLPHGQDQEMFEPDFKGTRK